MSTLPCESDTSAPAVEVPGIDPGRLAELARRSRLGIVRHAARQPIHIGASLSVVDILVAVLDVAGTASRDFDDPLRDRVLLSKGHAVWAAYAVLTELGVADHSEARAGHPVEGLRGVDAATGALGHGLAIGAGMALAARLDASPRRTVVILGDGELDEGSVWEAALFASHRRLDGLVAVVDRNGLQQEGSTEDVLSLEPLADKWVAFGWDVVEVDGHDPAAVARAVVAPGAGLPRVLLCRTAKGSGIPFMENDPRWHFAGLEGDELAAALAHLDPPAEPAA